ncbi:low molecular weight phosphatase family protein [Pseudooceanicola sp.]|uniref:arsenate-mycothiol transferase ArsC n=1 Tax=Pseudooceanicola sp. TaxID=1914328 RepID=UPI00263A31DE|nr:low molecular weight phosphatase family protein [Pseudooceanicola sp.]MDF1857305.1 low molecular weight phosphatase family protein [Pseudooceanicola sp.]
MVQPLPQAVLFCCDHNAVRSPMAEGIMKHFYGTATYVQSAGVHNDLEIDGFAIAVCKEIGVEVSRHRSRSFDEMQRLGDDLGSFDMIVALSPASQRRALDLTRFYHLTVDYWPIMDPTAIGETREQKLNAYRQCRDQIIAHVTDRWGPPQR